MKIPAFITVRTASSRLPRKCLLPFGDGNVIQHVIRRALFYKLDPIVCTTVEPADDVIVRMAKEEKVKYFRGSVLDKLRRWRDCCDHFGIENFHTVDADDLFFDGDLIRNSFALMKEGYDVVSPTEATSVGGTGSVGFSLTRSIVNKACELTKPGSDTEMMWTYLEKVKGVKKIVMPDEEGVRQARLTLDYEEDYWLLRTVERIVGSFAIRKEVDNLFIRNPDLFKINWFRNEEWKQKQLEISKEEQI